MKKTRLLLALLCAISCSTAFAAAPISVTQGERVTLTLKLTNVGRVDLQGVQVRLDPRTTPAWIHPEGTGIARVDTLSQRKSAKSVSISLPYVFRVAEHAPLDADASLSFLIGDSRRRVWRKQVPLTVQCLPKKSELLPNYPNPFNPETWIPYRLSQAGSVQVRIYDLAGNVVRTLELGERQAGAYDSPSRAAYWDGRNNLGERVATGLYLYRIETDHFSATGKMLIIK